LVHSSIYIYIDDSESIQPSQHKHPEIWTFEKDDTQTSEKV